MHANSSSSIIPPELLLKAYRSGIFPMADSRDDPDVFWVEPRMRAILPLDGFHLSQSLRKTLKKDRFRVTCNAAFHQVIQACAEPRPDADESWISGRIMASYEKLHRLGHAHSIECWDGERLVGGLYGVSFARVFCGESMFSRATDSSKVALAWLVAAVIRIATGSATVATITGAGIVVPVVGMIPGVNRELLVLATGAGSLILSHVNDAGFWLVKQYFNMTVAETFKTWTAMETILSIVALIFIMLLSLVV